MCSGEGTPKKELAAKKFKAACGQQILDMFEASCNPGDLRVAAGDWNMPLDALKMMFESVCPNVTMRHRLEATGQDESGHDAQISGIFPNPHRPQGTAPATYILAIDSGW